MILIIINIFNHFINNFKNIYGRFWKNLYGLKEYYIKLDGYYYCTKQRCYMAVMRIRNKRTIDIIPLNKIVSDKEYLMELHPADACVIGILANIERNEIFDNSCVGWKKMIRLKDYTCFVKSESILEICKKHINKDGVEFITLRSKFIEKETEIETLELCKNQALLYALDSFQTISLGYDASESFMRKAINDK